MGYRSEVAIKCEEKAYEKLMETCHNVNFMPDEIFKDEEDYILRWDWIKWNQDYDYIMAIESVLDTFDNLYAYGDGIPGYAYKFMRIGEDDCDVEVRQNSWDIELWMVRKIDIPEGLTRIDKEERENV